MKQMILKWYDVFFVMMLILSMKYHRKMHEYRVDELSKIEQFQFGRQVYFSTSDTNPHLN
jgi:hypothetical protein